MLVQPYSDATLERSLITDTLNPPVALRTWKLAARLAPDKLATLRTFYQDHLGGTIPFYFYDPFEVTPCEEAVASNYDGTGVNTSGRHIVRFSSSTWNETVGIARSDVQFEIKEVL